MRCVGRCVAAVVTVLAWGAGPGRADLIEMGDGSVRVGRVVSKDAGSIRLKTGTAERSIEVDVPRGQVKVIHTGLDEADGIDACKSAGQLSRWAAGYFQGGLEISAARCIRRAMELDDSMGSRARSDGAEAFRGFWNGIVLRRLEARVSRRDGKARLKLARWAWDAGLAEDAGRFLRQAWHWDRDSGEIPSLAAEWKVRLEPPFRLDLTPALRESLVSDAVQDEGTPVRAAEGSVFLTLPIRYDPGGPAWTLSRSAIRGRQMRGFYGLRVLRVKGGVPLLEPLGREPVYERLELSPGAARPIIARNTIGPRPPEGVDERPERIGPRERRLRSTGWAAIVVSVSRAARQLTLEWADGGTEVIDLPLVGRIRDPLRGDAGDPSSPALSSMLAVLRSGGGAGRAAPSAAMESLVLTRLTDLCTAARVHHGDAWIAAVDSAVLRAGAKGDETIGRAAWSYMTARRGLPVVTAGLLQRTSGAVQSGWVRLIASVSEDGEDFDAETATSILGAILRGDDHAACDAALDLMINLGRDIDWSVLVDGSQTARSLALSRMESVDDATVSSNMLIALIQGADSKWIDRLARYARRDHLRLSDPRHPLLRRWDDLTATDTRRAFLRLLPAVSLEQIVYSSSFDKIAREATAPGAAPPVRDAAFRLFIRQAERLTPTGWSAFGLLFPRDAADPLVRGLGAAAARGEPRTRVAALKALARAGFAEEALKAMTHGAAEPDERVLADLFEDATDTDRSDGMFALLGFLLRPEWSAASFRSLRRLRDLAAETPPADQWRMLAAVKSGVDYGALNRLCLELDPPESGPALRWLYETAHLSRQERQRLAAEHDAEQRDRELTAMNFRRGQLVDGRYGALAVIEITTAVEKVGGRVVWSPPQRRAIALPFLTFRSQEAGDGFDVLWAKQKIGEGRALDAAPRLKSIQYCYGVMDSLNGVFFTGGDTEPPTAAAARSAGREVVIGPVVLRSGTLPATATTGTIQIDVGAWLRSGLGTAASEQSFRPEALAPERLPIHLRYMRFGGYRGTLRRRPLPERAAVGSPHLLNVKLIVERAD
ncbi:MAG: hypothetical protein ACE5F9_11795 [Phycisphaerae bacterium]